MTDTGNATARRLVNVVRRELDAGADPARAPQMQRYMKSLMPYRGVAVPVVRAIATRAAAAMPDLSVDDRAAAAMILWRTAGYREDRYAATELVTARPARGELVMLDVYTEMIVAGAWWDHVDGVSHGIGALLLAHPGRMLPILRAWATDPDRWLRRSAIIAQLGHKRRTDTWLLTDVIEVNAADPEFFVRKAIGWSLRDYARTDPDWVRAFVATHELSPLSRREATKHL